MNTDWKFLVAYGIFPILLAIGNCLQLKYERGTRWINITQLMAYSMVGLTFFIIRYTEGMLEYWDQYLFWSEVLYVACFGAEMYDSGKNIGENSGKGFDLLAMIFSLAPFLVGNTLLLCFW